MSTKTPRSRGAGRLSVAVALGTVAAGLTLALTLPTSSAQSRPVPPGTAEQQPGTAQQQQPAPHVMDFAHGLNAPAKQQPPQTAGTPVAVTADGCDHAYGDINVCVPWTFPAAAGTAPGAGCRWLLAHGYPPLAVHGRDRLGLDTNHDGTACDHGDAGAGG
ncbi:hypothetical protein [Kitasatospora kifunensis]|uniref:Excalibur calcium-binding domain-containing protein n=1 Tax=Kitasatospora kifunensis TaxID=58351 RepID=A0A7W7R958_KITKI|nr:hypothetical protein [Kitasatospora kifunensis]MBB4927752.1 hypothetical protein [Kitasatospora kifunensis]